MNNFDYDTNKSPIENAFAKAEYYESIGDKENADKMLLLAQKYEEALKKAKQVEINPKKTNETYY